MDLQCKIEGKRSRTHWAANYEIPIGNDNIARNVPEEAAREMLTNPTVWQVFAGEAPREQGIVSRSPNQLGPRQPVRVAQIQTVEVPLVPRSLAYLEGLSLKTLNVVAGQFAVETEPSAGKGALARAILAAADEQLQAQLSELAGAQPPAATAAPSAAEAPAPAPETPAAEAAPAQPLEEAAGKPIVSSMADF